MKRYLALITAAFLTLSSSVCTDAESSDKELASAITAAKQYITVPSDQDDVDCEIRDGEGGSTLIDVYWKNTENGDNTYAELDSDGCLLTYYAEYKDSYQKKGLSKYGEEQTLAAAKAFTQKVYGKTTDIRLDESEITRSRHFYTFYLYANDIKITNGRISVEVDSDTCEVITFDGIGKEFLSVRYPQPTGIIDKYKAMTALFGKTPVPMYNIYTDYSQSGEPVKKAFLAFKNNSRTNAVNAFTGEKTEISLYFNELTAKAYSSEAAEDEDSADNGMGESYTPGELEAIDNSKDFLTTDKAAQIIKQQFTLAKDMTFKSSRIYKDYYSDNYIVSLSADGGSATLNAKSGKILSFYCYNASDYTEPKDGTEPKAIIANGTYKKLADNTVAAVAAAESEKLGEPDEDINPYTGVSSFTYHRIENGYECEGSDITLSITKDGEVSRYRNGFVESITFPQPANVLTGNKAVDALSEAFGFDLAYSVDESYNARLVYCFAESGYMDSTSSTRLNYKGEPLEDSTDKVGIDDVKGHWSEKYVTALYNNGYRLNDSLFRPDQAVTKTELDTLFGQSSYSPYYIDDSVQEESTVLGEPVTRYELADYILDYLGHSELEKYPDIFTVSGYNDTIDSKHKAAVAIVTAYGAMSGDNTGSFNGDKTATRAEAAAALYNLLINE